MIDRLDIEEIAAQIKLITENPNSVRKQLQQLNLVQQRLMIIKRELREDLNDLIQSHDNRYIDDHLINSGLAFLPYKFRKWGYLARSGFLQFTRVKRKAERRPYLELEDLVDDYLTKIEHLKLQDQEYLLNNS